MTIDFAGATDHTQDLADLVQRHERLRDEKIARNHEIAQLRGSMRGFIDRDVLKPMAWMREALELDPPRISYVLDALEDLEYAANKFTETQL